MLIRDAKVTQELKKGTFLTDIVDFLRHGVWTRAYEMRRKPRYSSKDALPYSELQNVLAPWSLLLFQKDWCIVQSSARLALPPNIKRRTNQPVYPKMNKK